MATDSNSAENRGSPNGLEGDNSVTKGLSGKNGNQGMTAKVPQQTNKKDRLDFTYDTVEETYGICLLGFVISGRPPTSALLDLVRRWGERCPLSNT